MAISQTLDYRTMAHLSLRYSIAFLFLFHCLSGFSPAQSFQFTEHLAIGDDETAEVEYLFEGPRHVTTDADGRIYVVDGRTPEVRVFSQSGDYLTTLGRHGEGPGEFLQISGMVVNKHSGDLIIADNDNQRFTIFPDPDASPTTIPYPIEGLHFSELHPVGQRYLSTAVQRLTRHSEAVPLVHGLSQNLSEIAFSTARSDTWWDLTDPFLQTQQRLSAITIAPMDESSFILAPEFYEGKIYKYRRQAGDWTTEVLEGRAVGAAPYEIHDVDHPNQAPEPRRSYSGPAGRFVVSPHRLSRGLFVLDDGRIVHFTYENADMEDDAVIVDLFTSDGQLLKSGSIKGYGPKASSIGMDVLWKDDRDRFYLVDRTDDFPVLRVVTFEEL